MNRLCCSIILFLVFLSCRKVVNEEFNDPVQIPVINSLLISDKTIEVHVSLPENINAKDIQTIENADISLFIDEIFAEKLVYTGEGIYSGTTLVEPGKSYKCEALIPGYKIITCNDRIPEYPLLYNVEHVNEAGKDEEGVVYPAVNLTFANNINSNQYFEVVIRTLHHHEIEIASLEKITDPLIIKEGLPIALFTNELINDTLYNLTLNYTTGTTSNTNDRWHTVLYPLIIEFRAISLNYYHFARSSYLYEQGRYPGSLEEQTKVFNLHSNIENGYGIFAGFSVVQSDTVYPNQN